MSFSKAKITRFNDVISCAPPPGAYDPKFNSNTTCVSIAQTERFIEPQSPAGSVTSESCSVKASSMTSFRTPTPICKKKVLVTKSNRKLQFPGSQHEDQNEILKDKIVECTNKTQFICELEREIEEQKECIRKLEQEVKRLENECLKMNENHQEKLQCLLCNHDTSMNDLKQIHLNEIDNLKDEIKKQKLLFDSINNCLGLVEKLKADKANIEDICTKLKIGTTEQIHEMEMYYDKIKIQIDIMKNSYETEKANITEKLNKKKQELDLLKSEYEIKIQNKEQTISDLKQEINHFHIEKENLNIEKMQLEKTITENTNTYLFSETSLKNDLKEKQILLNDYKSKLETKQQVIYDLQNELSCIQCELTDLKSELETQVAHYKKEKHDISLEYTQEINILKDQLVKLNDLLDEKDNKLSTYEATKTMLETNLNDIRFKLQEVEDKYSESVASQIDMGKNHAEEIKNIKMKHSNEIEDLEFEMLEIVTKLRKKINTIETEKDKAIKKVKEESELVLSQVKESSQEKLKVAEMQMEEKYRQIEMNAQLKLQEQEAQSEAILKECQAIGEYNIIQCELEKKEIVAKLKETKFYFHNLFLEKQKLATENEKNCMKVKNLEQKLSAIIIELNDVRAKYDKKMSELFIELEKAHNDKRKYAITLSETRATVEVLKRRLVDSDKDVLQLKIELGNLESAKLQVDSVCAELKDKISELEKEREKNTEEHNKAVELLMMDIHKTNDELNSIVDKYKTMSIERVQDLETDNKLLSKKLQDVMNHLKEQQILHMEAECMVRSARVEIERQENENIDLKHKLNSAETNLSDMHKLKLEIDNLKQENRSLKNEIEHFEEYQLTRQYNEQMYNELTIKYKDALNTIVELEKCVEKSNEEKQNILLRQQEIENAAKDIGQKYAELLGHQNNKQKIHHMVDLKNKNFELAKENNNLEVKIRSQSKLIEKLKSELSAKTSIRKTKNISLNKENVSPAKSLLMSSDNSNITPLKDRNSAL